MFVLYSCWKYALSCRSTVAATAARRVALFANRFSQGQSWTMILPDSVCSSLARMLSSSSQPLTWTVRFVTGGRRLPLAFVVRGWVAKKVKHDQTLKIWNWGNSWARFLFVGISLHCQHPSLDKENVGVIFSYSGSQIGKLEELIWWAFCWRNATSMRFSIVSKYSQ